MKKVELNAILEEALQLVRPYCEKRRKPSTLFFKSENMRRVKSSIVEELHAGLSNAFEELKRECDIPLVKRSVIGIVQKAKTMNDLIESVHVNLNPFHQSELGVILDTIIARLQSHPLMADQDDLFEVTGYADEQGAAATRSWQS